MRWRWLAGKHWERKWERLAATSETARTTDVIRMVLRVSERSEATAAASAAVAAARSHARSMCVQSSKRMPAMNAMATGTSGLRTGDILRT
jgi:hypothetical protein